MIAATRAATPSNPAADRPAKLLWGWPDVLAATGVGRRVLERQLAIGAFPRPVRRIGKRPYWRPDDIRKWAAGGAV